MNQQFLNDTLAKCKNHSTAIIITALEACALLYFYLFDSHPPVFIPLLFITGVLVLACAIYTNHFLAHLAYGVLNLLAWFYILLGMRIMFEQFVLGICFALLTMGLLTTAKHMMLQFKQQQKEQEQTLPVFIPLSEQIPVQILVPPQLHSPILPMYSYSTSEQQQQQQQRPIV